MKQSLQIIILICMLLIAALWLTFIINLPPKLSTRQILGLVLLFAEFLLLTVLYYYVYKTSQ